MKTTTGRYRNNLGRSVKNIKDIKGPWRGMEALMDRSQMDLLEQKCSKMILDCVDWQRLDSDPDSQAMQDVGHMYDMLYSIYCAKLGIEGQEYAVEHALRASVDAERRLKDSGSTFSSTKKLKNDDNEIIWYICLILVSIGVCIYYIILYFTVFDRNKETEDYLRR